MHYRTTAFLVILNIVGLRLIHGQRSWQNHYGQGHGFQSQRGHNRPNPATYVPHGNTNLNSEECTRPKFQDQRASLTIENCSSERHKKACWDSEENIPPGWKVTMICRQSYSTAKYPSTCTAGQWSPPLYETCNSAQQHENAEPHQSEPHKTPTKVGMKSRPSNPAHRHCSQLLLANSKNYDFSCLLPDTATEKFDCASLDEVPSGTIAMLKCKSPYYSRDGSFKHWVCENGVWDGDFVQKLKCTVTSGRPKPPDVSKYHDTTISTTTTTIPTTTTTTTIPTTKTTTTTTTPKPRPKATTRLTTTSKPTTRRSTARTTASTTTLKPKPVVPVISPTTASPGTSCQPLKRREGMVYECVFKSEGGVTQNACQTPQPVGSEAKYSCAKYYEPSGGLVTLYRKCKADGSWSGSSSSFGCIIQCGKNNPIFVPFITNGQPSFRGQWPWHSGIFMKESIRRNVEWSYICGGTLISRRAVMSAAHCVTVIQQSTRAVTRDAGFFRIDLGRFDRELPEDTVQAKEVSSIHVHPSYSPLGFDSDIAIIVLNEDVEVGYHVRPICFPQTVNSALEELHLSENTLGTVVGWGKNEHFELANELQMAKLRVASQTECSDNTRSIETGVLQAKSTTYCAGLKNGTKDVNVCNGDSGGGMYFPVNNADFTKWYIQGIVSVGIADEDGNCNPKKLSVFTRVGRYADWIVRVLSENDAL